MNVLTKRGYWASFALFVPLAGIILGVGLTQADDSTGLMSVPAVSNMALHEALWLASGVVAYALASSHMPALLMDYVAMRQTGAETLVLTSRGYLVRESLRMLSAMGTVSLGVYVCLQPPGPLGNRISLVGIVLTFVIIGQSALVAIVSKIDWSYRQRLEELILEGEDNGKEVV